METGFGIMERVEEHCEDKIQNRRLRFQLVQELNRLVTQHEVLKARIDNVLKGDATYDEKTHRVIRRSAA